MDTRRAVVVGASLAGLCAARVLADYFDEIVLVERDSLVDAPLARPCVPQGRHVHNLLARGQNELESLFPGFTVELEAAGAVCIDIALEIKMLSVFGWFPRHRSDLIQRCCSRGLIEQIVRRRALALARIRVLDGHEVDGLLHDDAGVRGVRCRRRPPQSGNEVTEVEALLVVDAGGRSSHLIKWLSEMGIAEAPVTEVDAFLGYATRIVRTPSAAPDWRALVVRNPKPSPRAGAIVPQEGGRWIVSLVGFGRDYPPTDEAGFTAFAETLVAPEFGAALRAAEPLSSVAGYRQTANRWRHFERLAHWPNGFAALGDAVCTFNPLYAQGMTVAAIEAAALRDLLAERGPTPDVGSALRGRVAEALVIPWQIATSEDYRYPTTVGPRRAMSLRALHWYGDRVVRAAMRSPHVHYRWMRVSNLLDEPASLFSPDVLGRALVATG